MAGQYNPRPIVINSMYKHEVDRKIKEWEARGYVLKQRGKKVDTRSRWAGVRGYFAIMVKEEQ